MTNLSEEKLQMINGGYSNLGRSTMGLLNTMYKDQVNRIISSARDSYFKGVNRDYSKYNNPMNYWTI